jgi:D-glycero-alpha-D-manno-heptose 1-phosphate guanylyltransferase
MHFLVASNLVHKAVIAVSYQAESIINFFSAHPFSIPVEFSYEKQPLGIGGAIQQALGMTSSEHLLIMNGDSYLQCSLQEAFRSHLQQGRQATLLYTHVHNASSFGRVEIDPQKKILTAFYEKTFPEEPGFINAGIYFFQRTLLEQFTLPLPFSFEKEFFPQLIPLGVTAFFSSGIFIDIGTPNSYLKAQELLAPLTQGLSL